MVEMVGRIPGMWAKTKANRNCILLKAISTWRQNAPKKKNKNEKGRDVEGGRCREENEGGDHC